MHGKIKLKRVSAGAEKKSIIIISAVLFCSVTLIAWSFFLSSEESLVLLKLSGIFYTFVLFFSIIFSINNFGAFSALSVFLVWWELVRFFLPKLPIFINGLSHHVAIDNAGYEINYVATTSIVYEAIFMGLVVASYGLFKLSISKQGFSYTKRLPFYLAVLLVGLISLLSFFYIYIRAGSVASLLMQRGMLDEDRIINQVGGFYYIVLKSSVIFALVWFCGLDKNNLNIRFWLFLTLFLMLNFLVTGSRSGIIIPLVLVGYVYCRDIRDIPLKYIFLGVFAAIFILGAVGQFRGQTQKVDDFSEVSVEGGVSDSFSGGLDVLSSYAGEVSGVFAIIHHVPLNHDYLYGESYKSIFYAPIPGFMIGSKPASGGRLLSEKIYNNPNNSIPPGNVGEAYWNFGVLGVFIVGLVFGVFLRVCDSFMKSNESPFFLPVFTVTLFFFQPNSNSFYFWIHSIVPALFYAIMIYGFPRRVG
ncbi:O-antigen polymerase [uncultured Alcanivorax sp.]|jgi:oligosaccharide repeat unit polymerase|uniref:O-antigen polymerase n=1 Tax=uncultured Alcanivorax sp. TaxID=191215 RepID=UPI0025881AFC|nr:O-antigen polymerase [uncultured Alcanivorax sp.]